MGRVNHFGMELKAVVIALQVTHGRDAAFTRVGQCFKTLRQFGNLVAMTHPDALAANEPSKKMPVAANSQVGLAKLVFLSRLDDAVHAMRH